MNKPGGKIITFYSYKGGTGRSMVLANVAWILASNGKKVLAVDWDLEAPGLHRYFHPFLLDKELTASEGIIDFVTNYSMAAMTPPQNESVPDKWYLPYADILRYAISLDWKFPGDGRLDLIPAGRQDSSYSTRVTSLDWQDFYGRLGGWTFLETAKEKMKSEYDFILIDSRTGVSDTSGICTVQMPDSLVVCYLLNNQSIEGGASVATSVHAQRKSGMDIFPVPMRVENAEKAKRDARKEYGRNRFSPFTSQIAANQRATYEAKIQFPYVPYYAYEEVLATFGDKPEDTNTLLESAERLTSYLTGGTITRLRVSSEASRRNEVLAAYAKSTRLLPTQDSTAETQLNILPYFLRYRPISFWFAVISLLLAFGGLAFGVWAGRKTSQERQRRQEAETFALQAKQSVVTAESKINAAINEANETKRQLAIALEAPDSQYKIIAALQSNLKDQTQIANAQSDLAQKYRQDLANCTAEGKKNYQDTQTIRLSLQACQKRLQGVRPD